MGDHDDGVGRLVMRGKTCEVKAATPKGEGSGRGGRSSRTGGQNRDQRKHDFATIGYSHISGSFVYPEHVAYLPVMHEGGAYLPNPQFQEYIGTTAASAPGIPPYMTPVYYPTVQYPPAHPPMVMAPIEEYVSTGGQMTTPPFFNMVTPAPDAASFAVQASHPSAATAGPMSSSPLTSQPVHSHYQHHHLAPPPYSQQAAYAFLPVAPIPPSAGVPGPPPGVVQATSVMQPVAPGLPFKHQENSSHDMDIGGTSVMQNQEVGLSN
jgi:hypothetical protein